MEGAGLRSAPTSVESSPLVLWPNFGPYGFFDSASAAYSALVTFAKSKVCFIGATDLSEFQSGENLTDTTQRATLQISFYTDPCSLHQVATTSD